MTESTYRGLAEFGLPLITRGDPAFTSLTREIDENVKALPVSSAAPLVSDRAAVLLNNTGRAIVAIEFIWRYTTLDGNTRTSRFSNFGSSVQREVLTGRCKVGRDLGPFILPGSKRLITERGIFGNNLDVLTPEELPRGRGFYGGFGGGGPENSELDISAVELVLELVILEDGLCVGPDESGLYESLKASLDVQRRAAEEALTALQAGASIGKIFEIIRPLARHQPLEMFGSEAVHHLINSRPEELLTFFNEAAQPPSLQLHRPS